MVDEKKKKKLTLTASPKKPVNVPLYIQDRKKTSVIVEKRVPKNRGEKKFYNRNDNFIHFNKSYKFSTTLILIYIMTFSKKMDF